MSELTKHGIHSNIKIPPESTGSRVHHVVWHAVEVSGLVPPTVSLPWDVNGTSGIAGFIVGYGAIQGSANHRVDIVLRDDSVVMDFTVGEVLTVSGTGISITCTTVTSQKIFNPAVSVAGGNNPNHVLSIDKAGSAYVRFTEGEQQLDPKGLTRVSTPTAVMDVKFPGSTNAALAFATIVGTASETALAAERILAMDVGTASGDSITKRTNRYAFFQGGFSSIFETSLAVGDTGKTNVVRRWGYYDGSDGLYWELDGTQLYLVVRSSTTGSIVNTRFPQDQWNGDTLDGSTGSANPSSINLDVSMMNYYFIDFPGSTAGKIRFGLFGPDGRIVAHEVFFGNNSITNFMRTANLPMTWEQFNSGVSASPSRMKTFGGAVLCEGFTTPESQIPSTQFGTWFMDTAKTATGSGWTNLVSTRSGMLAPDGVNLNRKSTIPQKLMYHVTGGPIVLQVRAGLVPDGTPAYFRPSPYYSPAEVDISGTFPASPLAQGLPIMTRVYDVGTHVIDPPASFNIRGQALALRSDGNYGTVYTFVFKPVNPADTVNIHVGIDWIDV